MQHPPEFKIEQPIPKDLLVRFAVSNSGFVFDPVTGNSFTLNDTGLYLFRQLAADLSIKHILQNIISEYELDAQRAQHELLDFIQALRSVIGHHE